MNSHDLITDTILEVINIHDITPHEEVQWRYVQGTRPRLWAFPANSCSRKFLLQVGQYW